MIRGLLGGPAKVGLGFCPLRGAEIVQAPLHQGIDMVGKFLEQSIQEGHGLLVFPQGPIATGQPQEHRRIVRLLLPQPFKVLPGLPELFGPA